MEIAGVHRAARAFDDAAAVYEQARPSYPPDAVRALADGLGLGAGRRVLDLAAGTGKLTRDLVATGAHVIAIEPVAGMRSTLATATSAIAGGPAVSVVAAVAQALPIGHGRLDAVTVAQAFHWFATTDAVTEIRRVIRPGGALGLIWNHRDLSDPLQAAVTRLLEPVRGDAPSFESGEWRHALASGDLFEPATEIQVAWRQPVDVDGVADRFASVSFVAALPPAERGALLDEIRAVASELSSDGAPLSLAYTTEVFLFTRIG